MNPYRTEHFTFSKNGTEHTVPFVVPKGYNKKWTSVDAAGNTILTYTYRSGPVFYLSYMADTASEMQPIVLQENLPLQSLTSGAIIYKGMDENMLYFREIRQNNYRMGYRFVNGDQEYKFDSATNYMVVWPIEKPKL